ncbi:unnamed protein product [Leptosia nina]|uniref:Aminopeptidase n=1 Tax=Leptosia nina TaxID=320188 RepID=A0AAV1JDI6_9NEOP
MGVFKIITVFAVIFVVTTPLPLRTKRTVTTLTDPLEDSIENLDQGRLANIEAYSASDNDNKRDLRNSETSSRNNLREGLLASRYEVKLTPNFADGTFAGVARISVILNSGVADPIKFHFVDLKVGTVRTITGTTSTEVTNVKVNDGVLEINTGAELSLYTFEIEYSGTLEGAGIGFYRGTYESETYVAMNLHPTNARRVFPCIDEPNVQTTISFTFAGVNTYTNVIANSKRLATQPTEGELQFEPLSGAPYLWGMMAHNLSPANLPASNVVLYTRPTRNSGDLQTSVAINNYFNFFNNFTAKPYDSIIANQQGGMHIMALPDVDRDWYALSTIAVWEPYIVIEVSAAARQKQIGFVKIAEAMSKQWFGYVLGPSNWRYQWVITGLGRYAAFEAARRLESNPADAARIDMDAAFVTDVIQESLLDDSYTNALPLEPDADLFNENAIRNNINGLQKTKAAAIMRMLSLVLSQNSEIDYVRNAAQTLFNTATLTDINSRNFYDTLSTTWNQATNLIGNLRDFVQPWVLNNNYPVIRIDLRQGSGVIVTQERFGFANRPQMNFMIPLSFTTSVNPDFNNIYPSQVMQTTATLTMDLTDDDWVIFNIQGQGYYRVNYETALWNRIISALEDETRRNQIHPINRAVLLDDALNLARSGRIEYSIALRIVLTMNLETEYVVWKAFMRNMNILRNHLQSLVDDNDNLDSNIYVRLIGRVTNAAETNLTFSPDPNLTEPAMRSLARGLIMETVCKANYQPCVAAAVDLFRDPNDANAINGNIPADIRPAVYCANIMSGGEEERNLLIAHLAKINNQYERVVILESLACSTDQDYIRSYLDQATIATSPYNSEEKTRIFKAVIESNYKNARVALNFLIQNTARTIEALGGPEKLEEVLYTLSRNFANGGMVTEYKNWVSSLYSNLESSRLIAERYRDFIDQDMQWNDAHLNNIYTWIDQNDAPSFMLSMMLLCISLMVALFNH